MRGRAALGSLAFALLTAVALVVALPGGWAARAQEGPAEVGAGPPGDVSLRLVGRAELGPDAVRLFGYLSGVIGLRADEVTTGGGGPAAARYTWSAEIPTAARGGAGDVTTFSGDGTLAVYRAPEGGAAWDDPASFAAGDPAASYAMTLAATVQRQSPALGAVVADGTLRQEQAPVVEQGGSSLRLGREGAVLRLRLAGALAGEAATGQPWPASLIGTAVVTDPGPNVRTLSATPGTLIPGATPAPVAATGDCDGWAAATRDRLRGAGDRATAALADPATAEAAASAVEAALAAQRAEPAAAEDAATQRLAASALGTYARALRALAENPGAGDAAGGLSDADALANRALADIAARYPGCG